MEVLHTLVDDRKRLRKISADRIDADFCLVEREPLEGAFEWDEATYVTAFRQNNPGPLHSCGWLLTPSRFINV